MEKYAYLIELLVSTGSHVLLRGEEGCGKTSLIKVRIPQHIIVFHLTMFYLKHCSILLTYLTMLYSI